MRNSAERLMTT